MRPISETGNNGLSQSPQIHHWLGVGFGKWHPGGIPYNHHQHYPHPRRLLKKPLIFKPKTSWRSHLLLFIILKIPPLNHHWPNPHHLLHTCHFTTLQFHYFSTRNWIILSKKTLIWIGFRFENVRIGNPDSDLLEIWNLTHLPPPTMVLKLTLYFTPIILILS